jgi:hypothetical protein
MSAAPADDFRWVDIDQRLLSPKISDLAEEMHKRIAEGERKVAFDARQSGNAAGYLPRLFDFHEQLTDEWAKRLYTAHCEAWVQQNRIVSAAFIRAVRDRAITNLIAVRKSSVEAEINRRGTAINKQPNPIALRDWKRRMDRLATRWSRKLEAEAVATEYRAVKLPSETATPEGSPLFDVFVSHATEDKNYVVPLVKALEAAGIRVWFDQNTLEWGDDLRSSIDRGLANCRYGIVVFSKAFLGKKKWTEYELNSLFALEKVGRKVILPIWHGITRDDLIQYSPAFADRLAKISSTDSYEEIVESLLTMLGRAKLTTSSEPATDTKKATKMQTMSIREGVPLKSGSTVPLSDRNTEVIVSSLGNTPYSPAPIPPQTEAARRLCDATRELEKASSSYVELHSRYGVAQAVRDVADEEKKILEKIEAALQIFERDYDLPTDPARVAKEELANINISLHRLTSGHDLETMKIAAEQVQDSCHRVREAAKSHAYLNIGVENVRRVQESELPAARPIIVPKRYGGGVVKDDMGYTGLAVVNDGEPAYDLTISNISIKDGAKLEFHRGHTERLTKSDGEAFYPAFVAMKLGGTFGSGLFDFMRERGILSVTVPITYRDFSNNWFQTDITLERDVEKSGGLRLGWTQKRISGPTSEVMSTSPDASSIVTEPAQAMTRNVETVLSVMTERKNWKRTDLAKLANISDDDALQALRALKDADKVIPIDVDEEPKGTFWRRI